MPFAEVNGTRMHYTDTGGAGPAVVYSHGLLFDRSMFGAQVAALQDRFRCITFDHRGQGQSAVSDSGYDMETLTGDAVALIRHLGVGPCHFVGLSMGGFVGMRIAARHPELVRSLTLLSTSAEAEPPENGPKYRKLNFVARWIGLWAVTSKVMPIMFGQSFLNDPARASERRHWEALMKANHRVGITRAVSGVIERDGCVALLGQITVPVGIGVGDEDVATVPAKSQAMQAAISGAELAILKGSGHSSSIEVPDQVTALIDRTIARAVSG